MERGAFTVSVLGLLEVTIDGQQVDVPRGKLRIALAELALSGGRVVHADPLSERVWGLDQPRSPKSAVQNIVLRLRRIVGPDLIRTAGAGYLLRIDPDDVDVLRFHRLLDEANEADTPERTRELLVEATELWRGEPFSDIGSEELRRDHAPALTERYLTAVEGRVDVDLTDRPPSELVAELRDLTARFPLRESLWERLLTVLYRAGRQAEALDEYERLRHSLVERLGTDPSRALRGLHERILHAAEPVSTPTSTPIGEAESDSEFGGPTPVPPAQVPFDVADFVGRTDEIAEVTKWLTNSSGVLAISAISGPGGMGKTTLAVHIAHRVAEDFPDGQLFARLVDADGNPRSPRDVLAVFLRALGVGAALIPETLEERAGLFRSRLRGRRVLVVLDDAATSKQLRPLLPGNPEAAALVTSRSRLVGVPGIRHVGLDVLTDHQALTLLYSAIGRTVSAGELRDAEEIVAMCGRLPLAVQIAGARLAARPHWRLRDFAERLADERRRLDELTLGDLEVRATLHVSYRGLDPELQRAFRRLGLLDAPSFPGWVLGAILDDSVSNGTNGTNGTNRTNRSVEPVEQLERLVESQLLEIDGYDQADQLRYRFHDLVRLYARERAFEEEPERDRTDAVVRVASAYLAVAEHTAADIPRPYPMRPWSGREITWQIRRPADPYVWFESERPALIALTEQVCDLGLVDISTGLASSLTGFLDAQGYFDELRRIHERALGVARQAEHRTAQAVLLCDLGEVHITQDRTVLSQTCFAEAAELAQTAGDRLLEANALSNLGYIARLRSEYEEASERYGRALTISVDIGDKIARAHATQGLGNIASDHGRYDEAMVHYAEALKLARECGFVVCAVRALRGLALIDRLNGDLEGAIDRVRQALREFGPHQSTNGLAHTSGDLAALYVWNGQFDEARRLYDKNLQRFDEHGDRFGVAITCFGIGQLFGETGCFGEARKHLTEAIRIFDELEVPYWRSRSAAALEQLESTELRASTELREAT